MVRLSILCWWLGTFKINRIKDIFTTVSVVGKWKLTVIVFTTKMNNCEVSFCHIHVFTKSASQCCGLHLSDTWNGTRWVHCCTWKRKCNYVLCTLTSKGLKYYIKEFMGKISSFWQAIKGFLEMSRVEVYILFTLFIINADWTMLKFFKKHSRNTHTHTPKQLHTHPHTHAHRI